MDNYKHITKSAYDDTAEEYALRDQIIISETSEVNKDREYFMTLLQPHAHILDIGCGAGRDDKYFLAKNFKVTGIDISEKMVMLAKKVNSGAKYLVMDLENLDFKDKTFDAIWANASLHHIPKNKLLPVIDVFRRLLKSKGIICIKVKLGNKEELVEDNRYSKKVVKFFAYYDQEELSKIITSLGFNIIQVKKSVANEWLDIFAIKS